MALPAPISRLGSFSAVGLLQPLIASNQSNLHRLVAGRRCGLSNLPTDAPHATTHRASWRRDDVPLPNPLRDRSEEEAVAALLTGLQRLVRAGTDLGALLRR